MTPAISVVMPARGGSLRLPTTLASLCRQSIDSARFEVLVVLDGPDPDVRAALAAMQTPFRLTVMEQPQSGAAAARNLGSSHAGAPLLLFLDDDMTASPGLLEAHLQCHAREPGGVVLGYFHQPRESARADTLADSADLWWAAHFDELSRRDHRFTYRDLCAGNVSVSRSTFLEAGGFSPDFAGAAGEDYELGIRLLSLGVRFYYCPAARTVHRHQASLARMLGRARDEGHGHVRIVRAHPQVFRSLELANAATGDDTGTRSWIPWTPAWLLAGLPRVLAPAWRALCGLKLRRRARKVLALMRYCAYWHGVRSELGTKGAQRRFVDSAAAFVPDVRELEVSLPADLERLQVALDLEPADQARLVLGGRIVGAIPAQPGAEPLRASHVGGVLRGTYAGAALLANVMAPHDGHADRGPRSRVRVLPPRDRRIPSRTFVGSLDLSAAHAAWPGSAAYEHVLLLIRDSGTPLGTLRLQKDAGSPLEPPAVAAALNQRAWITTLAAARLPSERSARGDGLPPISVVVCTRDRAESLRRCLASLRSLDYPEFEVIVVDNASRDGSACEAAAAHECRYVREDRPGLNWARNCGWRNARFDIVAYTDDDVEADRGWLQGIAEGFRSPAVQCVTGLVLPRELETRAQHLFEIYGNDGMSKGFLPRRWAAGRLSVESLIRVDRIGIGANMAYRRAVFERVGEFDTALDVGTPSGGGGDLDMLHRVLCGGGEIQYLPAALVWHNHRRDMEGLTAQIGNNGRAFGVYLLKRWRERRVSRIALAWYVGRRWVPWLTGRWVQSLLGRHRLPPSILWSELRGAATSGLAYRRTYRSDRRIRAASGEANP